MRPALIALAVAVLAGAAWTVLRTDQEDQKEPRRDLRALAAPSAPRVANRDRRPAEVSEHRVARREVEASEPEDAATPIDRSRSLPVDPAIAGTLEVQVVEFETGRPLVGATVHLAATDGAEDAGIRWLGGSQDREPTTDEQGLARFLLVPDRAFVLRATVADPEAAGADSRHSESVEPLRTGERRAVRLRLRTRPDLDIVGRVVDATTRAGVADARVSFARVLQSVSAEGRRSTVEVVTELRTDVDGRFEGKAASWRDLYGRVDTAGYGPALFPIRNGDEAHEEPLLVELSKGATLRGRVLGTDEPAALVVRAQADGHALMWRRRDAWTEIGEVVREVALDADGSWELTDLAPDVGLKLALLQGAEVLHRETQRLILAPGETREFQWRQGAGAAVFGRISVADDGAPLADHPVWLLPASDAAGPFPFHYGASPTASTTTDEHGRFSFDDVNPGEWKVGPAPVRNYWDQAQPDDVVPLGEIVVVPEGVADVRIDLTVSRGIFIRGEILMPDSARLDPEGWVTGGSDENGMWLASKATAGRFAFGPLVPGTYELTASAKKAGFAPSLAVEARAGDEGVVLRLRPGGSFHGRLVNAESGVPLTGEVLYVEEGIRSGGPGVLMVQADGRFERTGILPGSYRIQARAGVLAGEVRGVVVGPRQRTEVEVLMRAGATLEVRYAGVIRGGSYRVESDGIPFSTFERIEPGRVTRSTHPAGRVTVRLSLPGGEGEAAREVLRELDLVVGEVATLEFDDASR